MRGITFGLVFGCAAVTLLSACNKQENGTGRIGADGSEIARTGTYNGQDTHGEGVGTVNEQMRNQSR
jgi:hypothetical protein